MSESREMTLIEDLKRWRAERPDEWTMDRFIKKAVELEQRNKELSEALSTLSNHVYQWCKAIDERGGSWDEWDDYYKDCWYRDTEPVYSIIRTFNNQQEL